MRAVCIIVAEEAWWRSKPCQDFYKLPGHTASYGVALYEVFRRYIAGQERSECGKYNW